MSARRSPRDGSVYFDKARQRWVGVLEIGRDPKTRGRVRRKVSALTKSEARELLGKLRAEYERAGTVGRRDITVEYVLRYLLANAPAEWKSSITIDVNANHAEQVIKHIGAVRASKLTIAQVEAMLRAMAAAGSARNTISRRRSILSMALTEAQRHGLVSQNVAAVAKLPGGPIRRSKAMTVEQVRTLLALDLTAWWRAFIVTGVQLGLRPGELLGLRWEDVDFETGVIRCRTSLKQDGGKGRDALVLAGLKTDSSRRTQRMPASVRSALLALRREQAVDKLRLGEHYVGSGLVLADSAGQPSWPTVVREQFKALCERAGIGRDWQPRELRHTFVSQLSSAGVPIEQIADSAGHVNPNVTRAVYRHQLADQTTTAATAMDAIYGATS